MLNPYFNLVASVIYALDKEIREELVQKIIADERDYVSNLTNRIRDRWRCFNLPAFAFSRTLDRPLESAFGCDAIIVIRIGNKAKVCLFEAKYPRLSQGFYAWDSVQQSSSISHFSDQLKRQEKWSHVAAIWELFILDDKPGKKLPGFDDWASTCVWHDSALMYDKNHRINTQVWNNSDLTKLVSMVKTGNLWTRKDANLHQMLMQVCKCKKGNRFPIMRGRIYMRSLNGEESVQVPANLANLEELAPDFCEEYNIRNFLYMALDTEEE